MTETKTETEIQDPELKMMMFVGRHLPDIPHATAVVNRLLKPIYLRKPREAAVADVLGLKMRLQPEQCVDGGLLFYPQLYDRYEIQFLREFLQPGDTFLDVGANIGFYSLQASQSVGASGRVLAIEADPFNYTKLSENIVMNNLDNVTALNVGVSDKHETLMLCNESAGNRGGNSFLLQTENGVEVPCEPLLDILNAQKIHSVAAMKMDIEGFEFRVLTPFFAHAPRSLHPRIVITEFSPDYVERAGGSTLELIQGNGYRLKHQAKENYIFEKIEE
jgi:FkbM family methyltransferase